MTDNVIRFTSSNLPSSTYEQYFCGVCGFRSFKIMRDLKDGETWIECANCSRTMSLKIVETD